MISHWCECRAETLDRIRLIQASLAELCVISAESRLDALETARGPAPYAALYEARAALAAAYRERDRFADLGPLEVAA